MDGWMDARARRTEREQCITWPPYEMILDTPDMP